MNKEIGEQNPNVAGNSIRIQPVDELQEKLHCLLCQSVNRPVSPLFSSEPLTDSIRILIHSCLNIEITFRDDRDAHICIDCTDKLKSFSWFDYQGKSNDCFLKQLPEENFPVGELYCRLCLATNGRLQAIFPNNSQLDSNLYKIIKECIDIEINFYRDFGSHICSMCRTQLEMFATFKRICKQIRKENLARRRFISTEDEKHESMGAMHASGSLVSDGESQLVIVGFEDEHTAQKVKRKQNSQHEKNNSKKLKLQQEEPDAADISDIWGKNDRRRISHMLWMADDERNFAVIKEKKGRSRIVVDGYRFNFVSVKPDGSSIWHCEFKTLHNCKYVVTVGADCKIATFGKNMVHTHSVEPVRLLKCPPGKGFFLKEDGTEELFWLVSTPQVGKEYERQLIHGGQRYTLKTINSNDDTSVWVCKAPHCRATVVAKGILKFISDVKGTHKHPPTSNREIHDALRASKINPNATDKITPFREKKLPEWENKPISMLVKLAVPDIYTKLASEDLDRNYEVFKVRENLYKINYMDYYYKYYLKSVDGSTLWKCIWESIHNCMAMVVVSTDGKQASYYGPTDHCHPVETAEIFKCQLKYFTVRNITSDMRERMRLLSRECTYFQSRSLLFRYHIYNLYQIINNIETRWTCVKEGSSRQQCSALLIVNGQFESFLHKGEHCHPSMTKYEIKSVILENNILDLSALKHGEQSSKNDIEDSKGASNNLLDMLKQQLFAFPVGRGSIWDRKENTNHPFYFLTDSSKKNNNPYKIFYQQYRYSFASIDEYGTSQWICCQLIETNMRDGTCTAHLTIEGVFQRVAAKGKHNHEGISDSMVEYLCTKSENTSV